jgi:hypothetical protein
MQLTEVSVTGVRSAVITLQRAGTPLRIRLFPMIHLGTAAFYQQVAGQLGECQVVVAEGVGRSILTRALTSAYRTPGRSRRLGLTVQEIDYAALESAGVSVVRPDVTSEQLRQGWRSVPWVQRTCVLAMAPVFGIAFRIFGTRRVLARYLAVEDLPTTEDHLLRQKLPQLTAMILDDRDRLLIGALVTLIQRRSEEPVVIGVVYGAEHMVAVVRALAGCGFRPRRAEWLTVFDL